MEKNEQHIDIMFEYEDNEFPYQFDMKINFDILNLKVKSIVDQFDSPENYSIYFINPLTEQEIIISNNDELQQSIKMYLESKKNIMKILIKSQDETPENSLIKEEKNKVRESFSASIFGFENVTVSTIIKKDPCSKCQKNIKYIKYICLLCKNFQLCENCFGSHINFHPMIITNKNNFFPSNLNYVKYTLRNYPELKLDNNYKIQVEVYEIDLRFAMKKNSHRVFNIIITNLGNYINDEISINFLNTQDIVSIKPKLFSNVKKDEKLKINVEVNSFNSLGHIFVLIDFFCENSKVKFNEIKFEIKIVEDNQFIDENLNMLCRLYPNLNKLERDIKLKLYNAVKRSNLFHENLLRIENQIKRYGPNSLFSKK